MKIVLLIILVVCSGVLGRMGGAGKSGSWYDRILDTKYRDIGCSLIIVYCTYLVCGWQPSRWWAYLAIFGLSWASFTTYLDSVFGYDNLEASGLLVGLAAFPAIWLGVPWWGIGLRALLLCLAWGLLNKYLPRRLFIWRRDVVEEFLRYAISL